MSTDTGGPAFPNEGFNGWGKPQEGMTLRDYFAANAMQGDVLRVGHLPPGDLMHRAAKNAYAMADAMLKAREQ